MENQSSSHLSSTLLVILLWLSFVLSSFRIAYASESSVELSDTEESAIELGNQLSEELAHINENIRSLETEHGPFHHALLEPLQGLTDALVELGDFEEANRIIVRRLSLTRMAEGLETRSQLPILDELIANNVRLKRWKDVTENFERKLVLQAEDPGTDSVTVLDALNTLLHWHLSAIFLDGESAEQRSFHQQRISSLQKQVLQFATDNYGEDSPLLIPWLYQNATHQYRMFASGFYGEQGPDAYSITRNIPTRQREIVANRMRNIQQLRQIVESLGDPEAEVMAMIYEADFRLLWEHQSALELYRDAIDKLTIIGVDQNKIGSFFGRPIALPAAQFYPSLDEALADQSSYGYTVTIDGEGKETIHMGNFLAWRKRTPNVRYPAVPEQASLLDKKLNTVDLSFSISPRGKARSVEALQASPNTEEVKREAISAVRKIQFRPRIEASRWNRTRDVTMRYLYPQPGR